MSAKGFTLVELLMAIAIMAVLLMGMSASIVIASRAVGDGVDVVGRAVRTSDILGEIASDISSAEALTNRTDSSVMLTVADRDGDGVSDTIRYWWTGSGDGRLMRQLNDGPEVTLAEDVHEFSLTYGLTSMSADEVTDADGDGKRWHGRGRRAHWGEYWDHHGHAWGHYKSGNDHNNDGHEDNGNGNEDNNGNNDDDDDDDGGNNGNGNGNGNGHH